MKIGNVEVYGIIYLIKNKVNNKVYVGQTTLSFKTRYRGGKWWEQSHNLHLKSAVMKYGVNSFEIVECFDLAFSKSELDIKEIIYINLYKSNDRRYGYNKKSGGANGKHSRESIIKMSIVHKGAKATLETKLKMSATRKGCNIGEDNPMYGKNPYANLSEEEYARLLKVKSENMKGEKNPMYGSYGEKNPFYGKKHTEETKRILSEKTRKRLAEHNPSKGKKLPQISYGANASSKNNIKVFNSQKDLLYVFDSLKRCAEWMTEIGLSNTFNGARDTINRVCKRDGFYKNYYLVKESKNKES